MGKSKEEVIAQFNEEVNMTVEELEEWLKDPKSRKAGTGVGLESGHKIIEILRKNPTKDPEKYDEEDLEHMRKVVGYANRHLAQEDHLKETKTREELERMKSTISLKNWGHDPVKVLDEKHGDAETTDEAQAPDDAQEPRANGYELSDTPEDDEADEQRAETNDAEGQTTSKKRKLREEAVQPEEDGIDVNSVHEEEGDQAEGTGIDGREGHPSKKSKVDDAA